MDDIEVVDDERFIPTWPMISLIYLLGDGTGDVPYAIRDDGSKGVLLYSEELDAERFRDRKRPDATFVCAHSWIELGEKARRHAEHFGATHYAIDNLADEPDTSAFWLPFREIWNIQTIEFGKITVNPNELNISEKEWRRLEQRLGPIPRTFPPE